MLPDLYIGLNCGVAYRVVEDVLINNFNELDVDFAPYGMKLFERSGGKTHGGHYDINYLSKDARANYGDFIQEVHENHGRLGLSVQDLAHIVRPYVIAAISTDDDGNDLLRRGVYHLREPWLKEYLQEMPDVIKEPLADKLYLKVMYGDNSDIGKVVEIMRILPNPKEMLELMVEECDSKKCAAELIHRFNRAGYNIKQIIG
jgi:hypothetical protein